MFSNMWSVSLAVGRDNLTAQAITLPITHFPVVVASLLRFVAKKGTRMFVSHSQHTRSLVIICYEEFSLLAHITCGITSTFQYTCFV